MASVPTIAQHAEMLAELRKRYPEMFEVGKTQKADVAPDVHVVKPPVAAPVANTTA